MPFISIKDVLPYCKDGYKNLIKANPEKIIIFLGEERHLALTTWDKKYYDFIPSICPFSADSESKEQIRLLPTLKKHLELITNLKEIVLSPELSKFSFNYCKKIKNLLEDKYIIYLLKPYPDHPDWKNLDNIKSENVSMIDYLWEYPFLDTEDIKTIIEIFP